MNYLLLSYAIFNHSVPSLLLGPLSSYTGQHSIKKGEIHPCLGGIRIRGPSVRAVQDSTRLSALAVIQAYNDI